MRTLIGKEKEERRDRSLMGIFPQLIFVHKNGRKPAGDLNWRCLASCLHWIFPAFAVLSHPEWMFFWHRQAETQSRKLALVHGLLISFFPPYKEKNAFRKTSFSLIHFYETFTWINRIAARSETCILCFSVVSVPVIPLEPFTSQPMACPGSFQSSGFVSCTNQSFT